MAGKAIKAIEPSIVRYIAASEMIEEPLAVVRELVDNALDAGATRIDILVKDGGHTSIQVDDNGDGISFEDLPKAVLKHHSSKVGVLDDVLSPVTRGFRGEALHSISSVADIAITSRVEGDDAWRMELEAGSIEYKIKPGLRKEGTSVVVGRLFANIPARRNQLGSVRNSTNKIVDYVKKVAIFNTGVDFRLRSGATRILLDTSSDGSSFKHRLASLTNGRLHDAATFLQTEAKLGDEIWRLEMSAQPLPPGAKAGSRDVMACVNGFIVKLPQFDIVLSSIWKTLYSIGNREFIYAVRLTSQSPTRHINFNAHPGKTELTFLNEAVFFSDLQGAISKALKSRSSASLAHQLSQNDTKISEDAFDPSDPENQLLGRAIGQYRDGYILAETRVGLLVIDQHAAHEKLLAIRMLNNASQSGMKVESRKLVYPVLISDDMIGQVWIENAQRRLSELGARFEFRGSETYLTHAPYIDGVAVSLGSLLLELAQHAFSDDIETIFQKIAFDYANKACKKAIKSGHKLTLEQMNSFLRMMEKHPETATMQSWATNHQENSPP